MVMLGPGVSHQWMAGDQPSNHNNDKSNPSQGRQSNSKRQDVTLIVAWPSHSIECDRALKMKKGGGERSNIHNGTSSVITDRLARAAWPQRFGRW